MLKIYCHAGCDTCRKAQKWLKEHGIEYAAADIRSEHPDDLLQFVLCCESIVYLHQLSVLLYEYHVRTVDHDLID